MSDTIISVDNISKRYRLHHQAGGYTTLRDSLTAWAKGLVGGRRTITTATDEEFWALKDVSFEIKRGEVVGIIGRNGAGKSTLLKILSRITEPTAGRIRLGGRVASLLEVGTGFHPELTGRENIFLNGAILGMTKTEIKAKFDEIVAFSEVEKFLDTPVKHYSSGMYVRLAFAVAAHLDPEILIVDEVLAVGDAQFQKKCLGKMKNIAGAGRTVLFVSHNLPSVTALCDRAIQLTRGTVAADGEASHIATQYACDDLQLQAERVWSFPGDAPGDDIVRLISASVTQNDRVVATIDINFPFDVNICFDVLQPAKDLVTGIGIHSADEQCLAHCADWKHNRLPKGRYTRTVHIPAPTIAEGLTQIAIQLAFCSDDLFRQSVYITNALSFEAVETSRPNAVRGRYQGDWPGRVRLAFPWGDFQQIPQS